MGRFYPVALDGMQYYSSKKICCKKCLTKKHGENITYSHQVITPTIVSPFMREVLPLMPKFVQNRDGTEKQDCEINASKRWLKRKSSLNLARLLLGDARTATVAEADLLHTSHQADMDGIDWLDSKKFVAGENVSGGFNVYDYTQDAYGVSSIHRYNLVNDDGLGILCVE